MFGDVTWFSFSVFNRNSSWRELRELSGSRLKSCKGPSGSRLSLRFAILPHAGMSQYGPASQGREGWHLRGLREHARLRESESKRACKMCLIKTSSLPSASKTKSTGSRENTGSHASLLAMRQMKVHGQI